MAQTNFPMEIITDDDSYHLLYYIDGDYVYLIETENGTTDDKRNGNAYVIYEIDEQYYARITTTDVPYRAVGDVMKEKGLSFDKMTYIEEEGCYCSIAHGYNCFWYFQNGQIVKMDVMADYEVILFTNVGTTEVTIPEYGFVG